MPNLSNQLFEAIHKNSLEAVHDLIERGVKINLKNALGETPLCAATRTGNLAIVELLIKNGAEINIQSDWGETPIFAAARNGDLKTVELLIKNGADITLKNNRGETPLSVAVNLGRLNIVGFLNKLIFLSNQLFEAICKDSLEAVHSLIERGVKSNLRNNQGETPLHAAARTGNLAIVERLIENGAAINLENNDKETPLFAATESGNLAIVERLIENGADIDLKNDEGETPLYAAARTGNSAAVERLIENGADIDLENNQGETPIFAAARTGNLAIVELLIKNGADITPKNNRGETPLSVAVNLDRLNIVGFLNKIISLFNQLSEAIHKDSLEAVYALIDRSVESNLKNILGETPLFLAIQFKYTKISYTIIDHLLLRDINIEKPEILNTQGNLSNYWDKCKSKLQKIIISNKNKVISLHDFLTTQDDIKLVSLIRYKGVYNKLMWLKKKTNPQVGTIHGKLKLKFKEAVSKHKLHRKIEKKLKSLTFLNSYLDHITRVNLAQALSSVDISLFSETQLTNTLGSYVDCSHPGPFQIPRGSGPEKVVQ